jgi:protein-disulfide isomerase
MKTFISISVLVVVLVAVLFWATKGAEIKPSFEVGVIHQLDNIKGNPEAKIIITEYSDFQCPACRTYYFLTKELMVEFGDEVAFVYRHFPLTQIHANAEFAARASEAAGKQGKFWEMHDILFEKQSEWSNVADIAPLFESYAKLIDISVEQFRSDWQSREIKDLVRAQKTSAIKLDLPGTPSFFINNKQIENPGSEAFRSIIKEALQKNL